MPEQWFMVWAIYKSSRPVNVEVTAAEDAFKRHYGKYPVYAKVNPCRGDLIAALENVGYHVETDTYCHRDEIWFAQPVRAYQDAEVIDD